MLFRFRFGSWTRQLESDELLSDTDAAIDLHSGEAEEWVHKFHIVHGLWLGRTVPLDSTMRVGTKSEWFDWSQVVAWFSHGADGGRATSSAPRPRPVHNDVVATNPGLADIFGPLLYLLELGPRVYM